MTEVLDHVARARLPWRNGPGLTECGRTADPTERSVLTADEFIAKVKAQGQQRASMSTCMTCWSTTERWYRVGGRRNPVLSALVREAQRAEYAHPDEPLALVAELRAIAALIDAHRDEFDGYLAGLAETTDLDARRAARARPVRARR